MRLTFLGKNSDFGDSPTLYATDHGNYLVQGPRLADDHTRRRLAIPEHEDAVEVPKSAILALL